MHVCKNEHNMNHAKRDKEECECVRRNRVRQADWQAGTGRRTGIHDLITSHTHTHYCHPECNSISKTLPLPLSILKFRAKSNLRNTIRDLYNAKLTFNYKSIITGASTVPFNPYKHARLKTRMGKLPRKSTERCPFLQQQTNKQTNNKRKGQTMPLKPSPLHPSPSHPPPRESRAITSLCSLIKIALTKYILVIYWDR